MARVSERIEHHTRRVHHHVKHAPRGLKFAVSAICVLLLILLSGSWYELYSISNQNISHPVACATLLFHQAECTARINTLYADAAPLDRIVCKNRSLYGNITVCAPYDEAVTEQLYSAGLAAQGIAPWEPENPITHTTFHVRTLGDVSSVRLVCDGHLVETTGREILIAAPVNGSCVLIATTAQGSITSLPFNMST